MTKFRFTFLLISSFLAVLLFVTYFVASAITGLIYTDLEIETLLFGFVGSVFIKNLFASLVAVSGFYILDFKFYNRTAGKMYDNANSSRFQC
ncbi:hypothetical protein L4C54_23150 [Vibrio lamellibrachiae]|uniref:hypothetical protein n=1 Tax=Vibrio lamellibrachiae TaxID=2910253 RepID=UPI003D10A052